ncbi:hypothetical protein RHMOL_Rhmol12G0102400 [Rhododendron molle]|uniref:Uncharacterized protein n=2 Tax=Rhododendron molle TaxID=49168 RepID=A0ACC0LGF0_RHOML|nr:hypothetical protein RHMOL_Rhmol12G0102400 [Rhododendron molle]KAI8527800.1 hypothetical protein RHMOL_Rhmol12G0102400 [Rhododendron molle]
MPFLLQLEKLCILCISCKKRARGRLCCRERFWQLLFGVELCMLYISREKRDSEGLFSAFLHLQNYCIAVLFISSASPLLFSSSG